MKEKILAEESDFEEEATMDSNAVEALETANEQIIEEWLDYIFGTPRRINYDNLLIYFLFKRI